MTTLVWFRQDLRTADNPALAAAAAAGDGVVPIYLDTPLEHGAWAPGAASRWWLHYSLECLSEDLAARGSRLTVRASADTRQELIGMARECGATRVLWNRCYEPAASARDQGIKAALGAAGLAAHSYNSALLREPWEVANKAGGPYQVFTPFWRHCLSLPEPAVPLPAPRRLAAPRNWPQSTTIANLALLPRTGWTLGLHAAWRPGSEGAAVRLAEFLRESFDAYGTLRNRPDLARTSRLSPHLHFGEIGPRQIWHAARVAALAGGRDDSWRQAQFFTELGWREFAHHLLFHFPHTPTEPLRTNFARFPWQSDPQMLCAWQRGMTGYPIVDAGLRELWRTGWMHNRLRMIVASFLVKDLLLPWTLGARWFWDTLVDADLASNTLGWQWVAGCGADAAPFFRIFNPCSQGSKFDPDGGYVRLHVPELAQLPNEWIHRPWEAPPTVLQAAAVRLGETYPKPVVDHGLARDRALAAFATLKN